MDTNWAADHLQTIRTLMERSALYRRALSPIMLVLGTAGVLAAAAGIVFHLNSFQAFAGMWLGTAVLAIAVAFLIARRQALHDHDPFWSAPTRRAAQSLLPPLTAGLCLSLSLMAAAGRDDYTVCLPLIWMSFYGCALHAVGFFMPRGMKLFGWIFIACACAMSLFLALQPGARPNLAVSVAHYAMGLFFGVLHLAYGTYLHFTEKGKNAA